LNNVEKRLGRVEANLKGLRSVITEVIQLALVNPLEELTVLKHTGSVEDYVVEFRFSSSQCECLSEQQLLGYFIGKLVREWRGNTCEREYKRCVGGKEGFIQYQSIRNLMVEVEREMSLL